MNLTEQQTPAFQQPAQATFAPHLPATMAAPAKPHPLVQLENRLASMSHTIAALKNKVAAMQESVGQRDRHIASLEQENGTLKQQIEAFSGSHDQLLDGLASMLARFPGDEEMQEGEAENAAMPVDLLVETMGTA
ncbi:MAG: cell division protein ZapB [Magnetococcales bacterium]|nr:cell division protein ZapB [Magnetococcales bacterium]